MLKLILFTAFMRLPYALLIGLSCFAIAQRTLRCEGNVLHVIVRATIFLCILLSAAGIIYGVLRFSGVLLYASDNSSSCNWFDESFQDEGFQYIYLCATVLVGIGTALLRRKTS